MTIPKATNGFHPCCTTGLGPSGPFGSSGTPHRVAEFEERVHERVERAVGDGLGYASAPEPLLLLLLHGLKCPSQRDEYWRCGAREKQGAKIDKKDGGGVRDAGVHANCAFVSNSACASGAMALIFLSLSFLYQPLNP